MKDPNAIPFEETGPIKEAISADLKALAEKYTLDIFYVSAHSYTMSRQYYHFIGSADELHQLHRLAAAEIRVKLRRSSLWLVRLKRFAIRYWLSPAGPR